MSAQCPLLGQSGHYSDMPRCLLMMLWAAPALRHVAGTYLGFPLALAFLHWTTDEVGYPRNEARHLSHISRILFLELT